MQSNRYSIFKLASFPDKVRALQEGRVTPPIYVRVKPINRCNQDCHFCTYASGWRKANSADGAVMDHIKSEMHEDMKLSDTMPWEKMQELLLDFYTMGVKAITFSGGGEPLMYPQIVDTMNLTLGYGLALSMLTNGELMTGERAQVLKQGSWVRVSMDYTCAKEMVQSRRVHPRAYDRTLENLQNFAALPGPCDLGVNYIVHRNNYRGLVDFAALLKRLGVRNVRFSPIYVPNFLEYHASIADTVSAQLLEAQSLADESFSVNSTYELGGSGKSVERAYDRCLFMQVVPVVGADQRVYACHNKAYDKSGCIGSIEHQSFDALWNSAEAKAAMEGLNPKRDCRHECANDTKNLFYHELIRKESDPFV